MSETIQHGVLYIVSTPIGNLEDITRRGVTILSGVDLIAAEDTRTTRILLNHLGIEKPLISYFVQNEVRRIPELIQRLQQGSAVALVTDAGTPGISDPAYALIRAALQNEIRVIPVPGASALLAALVASGLPTDRFVFEGFLPHKKGRKTRIGQLKHETRTIVLYESPHRIERTLRELTAELGARTAVLARELTKKFEEVRRGTLVQLLDSVQTNPPKGEIVLVVEGCDDRDRATGRTSDDNKDDDHG
ncbi:MAG: rsmI [Bacteroidetes bacterium]|jgi:16S rRNA (cytidine1402-2'-O)-methyltransferase|nr:rsmI [Bacteroidota bacterium]